MIENVLSEKLNNADMVLVGIGEEMSADTRDMSSIQKYAAFMNDLEEDEKWLLPYAEKIYLKENPDSRIKDAYKKLEKILEGKNYFIVSTASDDMIYDTKLKQERIVTPCGGYRFMQCLSGCKAQVTETDEKLVQKISNYINGYAHGQRKEEKLLKPVCENCGADMVFNKVNTKNYVEEGYLKQWNQYKLWLQGTVNHNLCVLELGAGMQFPTVIRWPFEKVVYLNQKAYFFRVHSKLYQLTEEISNRGYSIKENPVNFLLNWFV